MENQVPILAVMCAALSPHCATALQIASPRNHSKKIQCYDHRYVSAPVVHAADVSYEVTRHWDDGRKPETWTLTLAEIKDALGL